MNFGLCAPRGPGSPYLTSHKWGVQFSCVTEMEKWCSGLFAGELWDALRSAWAAQWLPGNMLPAFMGFFTHTVNAKWALRTRTEPKHSPRAPAAGWSQGQRLQGIPRLVLCSSHSVLGCCSWCGGPRAELGCGVSSLTSQKVNLPFSPYTLLFHRAACMLRLLLVPSPWQQRVPDLFFYINCYQCKRKGRSMPIKLVFQWPWPFEKEFCWKGGTSGSVTAPFLIFPCVCRSGTEVPTSVWIPNFWLFQG